LNITSLSAHALSSAIHERTVSCVEVMNAYLDRIEALNPQFNAIVNLIERETLINTSKTLDQELSRGHSRGWMHGFPCAPKDLALTQGLTTTLGSPLFADHIPTEDTLAVARMRAEGAVLIGKTNTPEFGLGSNTYNTVFGTTANAYNPKKTAGGSSGGAAVALALNLLPVADGSDFMGSLRNPAAYANVFGLRPSIGRVPTLPAAEAFISSLGVEGPMAKTVDDLARLLATMSGHAPQSPWSLAQTQSDFAHDIKALLKEPEPQKIPAIKVAWLGDLSRHLALEPGIKERCKAGLARLGSLGAEILETSLQMDPTRIWKAWLTWRAVLNGHRLGPLLQMPRAKEQMKAEALWEIEQSRNISAQDLMAASATRTAFHREMLRLLDEHEVLALPSAQVWPFDKDLHWPPSIETSRGSRPMDTYHRWMEVVIYASFAGLPAINVPVGFNAQGLPMGMQLIGKPQGEVALLRVARAYETQIGDWLSIKPSV
jgi:amidase